jgi:hypothetical protein
VSFQWTRADLLAWGERLEIKSGTYIKTWDYSDKMENRDGLAFYLTCPGGERLGPFEDEDAVDAAIKQRENSLCL